MQLTSILLLSAAAVSVSAFPAAIEDSLTISPRDGAAAASTTGSKTAGSACDHSGTILDEQVDEMAKLKAQKISIPPYLAGYYAAMSSGRQAIGCPDDIPVGKRDFTPTREPCDVINEQHERMMELVDRFQKGSIGIAPFIAGFVSATQDVHGVFGCKPFTGEASEAPVVDPAAADDFHTAGSD